MIFFFLLLFSYFNKLINILCTLYKSNRYQTALEIAMRHAGIHMHGTTYTYIF